jgi:type I restriction enzyme S subunit
MNTLLAIKPEFAEKILSGEKKYEFRRTGFKSTHDLNLVYLYSSSPVMRIVGGFSSGRTVEAEPTQLWKLYNNYAGIDYERFMEYFEGVETGYAIQVDETFRFDDPIDPNEIFESFTAPVSYLYLDDERDDKLQQRLPPKFRRPEKTNLAQYVNQGASEGP